MNRYDFYKIITRFCVTMHRLDLCQDICDDFHDELELAWIEHASRK